MDHIEKMVTAICTCEERCADNETVAQAAFDALMDAVPDLVWVKSDYFQQYASGSYRVQREYNRAGRADWAFGVYQTCISRHKTKEAAFDAANAHHRKLAREIWGG